jgi:hypothetical protein
MQIIVQSCDEVELMGIAYKRSSERIFQLETTTPEAIVKSGCKIVKTGHH